MAGFFSRIHAMQLTLGTVGGWRFSSVAKYGLCVTALGLFFSEWRVVTRKLPIYNMKYENNWDYEFLRDQDRALAEAEAAAKAKAAERNK